MRLIPVDDQWSPVVRGAQTGFGFFGFYGLFVSTLMSLTAIIGAANVSPILVMGWFTCTAIEALHVYRIAISSAKSSKWSWFMFFLAITGIVLGTWSRMPDPGLRLGFTAVAVIGTLWLASVRVMVLGLGNWLSRRHDWYPECVLLVAWSPLFIAAGVGISRLP